LRTNQAQRTIQGTRTITRTTPQTFTITKPIPKTPRIPTIIIPPFGFGGSGSKKEKSSFGGFDVFVRVKGKLERQNFEPLTKRSAFALGGNITEGTAKRSLLVLPSTLKGSAKELPLSNIKSEQYYVNKKGSLVERTKFAINSPGEISEIQKKGVEANRKKNWFEERPKKQKKAWGFV
jgi:hypothetical protein